MMGSWNLVAALVLSSGIGLTLGLVGGGGSIVTVPILVYVAGFAPREAIALSLPIVGATAAVGAIVQARQGKTHGRAALIFATAGMLGALLGARLTPLVPEPVLMMLFAALMLLVGGRMALGRSEHAEPRKAECNPRKCGAAGLGVGVLTGFLGVGGGFLIVPALLRFAKMPMAQAVGTSLIIIAANSASGFAAHWGEVRAHGVLALAFTGAALLGLGAGLWLGRRMKPAGLKLSFGALSLVVACYLIIMNLRPLSALLRAGG